MIASGYGKFLLPHFHSYSTNAADAVVKRDIKPPWGY